LFRQSNAQAGENNTLTASFTVNEPMARASPAIFNMTKFNGAVVASQLVNLIPASGNGGANLFCVEGAAGKATWIDGTLRLALCAGASLAVETVSV
jgi:hypothetical protein